MDTLFKRVLVEINRRSHLQTLLPSHQISISFKCEDRIWAMNLSKVQSNYTSNIDEKVDLEIHVSKQALPLLLNGDIRLYQLVKYGEVQVKGSYRYSLLVESLLWLCREYKIA
ncbi:SCP2 sterol-binding domain-containing protein [Heyndrickxia sp. FSL W8-0423]|uniref:SCP2 sterol-binding domain-containing protein n=1 Tax=Heyndrickxia sp. FSL W8-0423 TaxID=2921601 RepID=UPI0030F9F2AE